MGEWENGRMGECENVRMGKYNCRYCWRNTFKHLLECCYESKSAVVPGDLERLIQS